MGFDGDIRALARQAKDAGHVLANLDSRKKNQVLLRLAELLAKRKPMLCEENARDLDAGRKKGLSAAMLDRLELSNKVMDAMIQGLHEIVALPDPVGAVENMLRRPNGILVGRMRIPLGVIGIIYESRPNVTVDAAALCLKAGNSVILRGGSEALYSNLALASVLKESLAAEGVPDAAVQIIPVSDREAVTAMLQLEEEIDLIIPRGGEGLIRFVMENSRIPVLKHYKGVCHLFVDESADQNMARRIIMNAKTQRPGVCNALETLLIHEKIAAAFLPAAAQELTSAGVEIRACARTKMLLPDSTAADDSDWGREFLSLILAVRIVENLDAALEHIRRYGSRHTEAIVTNNHGHAMRFLREADASAVMVNASTRFNDGGQFGLGAEIGISTTKLHAYGPMGLEELTTRKFIVFGEGQVRE